MLRNPFWVLALGPLCGTPLSAQAPSTHWLGPAVPLPDSLVEHWEGLSVVVSRRASSDFERQLLEVAERLYPAAEDFRRAETAFLERNNFGSWPERVAEARREPGPRWWWFRDEWARLPFALTATAVEALLSDMRRLGEELGQWELRPGDGPPRGSFEYRAAVAELADGRWVVTMEARWAYSCGRLCGLWFSKERRVLFDGDGEVLAVEGDGIPEWSVS